MRHVVPNLAVARGPVARDRGHGARPRVDDADRVVRRVRDVDAPVRTYDRERWRGAHTRQESKLL